MDTFDLINTILLAAIAIAAWWSTSIMIKGARLVHDILDTAHDGQTPWPEIPGTSLELEPLAEKASLTYYVMDLACGIRALAQLTNSDIPSNPNDK